MAAHLKKPFNPAFCDYKAHPNKYKCDFFSLPQCRETFGRQDFLFFWNIMRTLECVLKINWFVSTILEAWCYWIMEKTAIHIAYSWNKWGNFQWKLIWFSGIPTQNPSVSSYCGQKFRLWSFLSIPPSYLFTSESPAKAANRLLFCHSVSSLRALVPCDKHCPMLFQDTYGSVLIMHLCNLLSLLSGQGCLSTHLLPCLLLSTALLTVWMSLRPSFVTCLSRYNGHSIQPYLVLVLSIPIQEQSPRNGRWVPC